MKIPANRYFRVRGICSVHIFALSEQVDDNSQMQGGNHTIGMGKIIVIKSVPTSLPTMPTPCLTAITQRLTASCGASGSSCGTLVTNPKIMNVNDQAVITTIQAFRMYRKSGLKNIRRRRNVIDNLIRVKAVNPRRKKARTYLSRSATCSRSRVWRLRLRLLSPW